MKVSQSLALPLIRRYVTLVNAAWTTLKKRNDISPAWWRQSCHDRPQNLKNVATALTNWLLNRFHLCRMNDSILGGGVNLSTLCWKRWKMVDPVSHCRNTHWLVFTQQRLLNKPTTYLETKKRQNNRTTTTKRRPKWTICQTANKGVMIQGWRRLWCTWQNRNSHFHKLLHD